jgi:hypothetical protein
MRGNRKRCVDGSTERTIVQVVPGVCQGVYCVYSSRDHGSLKRDTKVIQCTSHNIFIHIGRKVHVM